MRQVLFRPHIRSETGALDIAHNANYLAELIALGEAISETGLDVLADGVLVGKIFVYEVFRHDDDECRVAGVRFGELATFLDGNADSLEEARSGDAHDFRRALPRR